MCLKSSSNTHPVSINMPCATTTTLTNQLSQISLNTPCLLDLLYCSFIYPCYLALQPRLSFLQPPTMVSTRTKNKTARPAAPVMTERAKQKAGIKAKPRKKRVTKDQTIRELQARLAALQNPDEEAFSKDPLVCIASLPIRPPGANET